MAGLYSLKSSTLFEKNYKHPVLVACTDSVGTKVKLAQARKLDRRARTTLVLKGWEIVALTDLLKEGGTYTQSRFYRKMQLFKARVMGDLPLKHAWGYELRRRKEKRERALGRSYTVFRMVTQHAAASFSRHPPPFWARPTDASFTCLLPASPRSCQTISAI